MPRSGQEERKMLLFGIVLLGWRAKPATCLWLTGGARGRDGGEQGGGRYRQADQAGVLHDFIKDVPCHVTVHDDT